MPDLHSSNSLPSNLYLADQIKQGEKICAKQVHIDMYQLMEKAGHGVFECLLAYFPQAKLITVLAGNGNNAGDAYVVARLALQSELKVQVYSFAPQRVLMGDAEIARQAYLSSGGTIESMDRLNQNLDTDVVIDGLLGIGMAGDVRPNMVNLIELVNNWDKPVVAIDLPSGLNADTGAVGTVAIRACYTVTFVALKLGLFIGKGPDHCGRLLFSGLGIDKLFRQTMIPVARLNDNQKGKVKPRLRDSNKGSYGHVLCIGGNQGMAGAVFLSAKAALRSGAGKVSVLTHMDNVATITNLCPELMVTGIEQGAQGEVLLAQKIKNASAIVIGPGLGTDNWGQWIFGQLIYGQKNNNKPLVIDADAINLLATHSNIQSAVKSHERKQWVLTPHLLEAARLMDNSVKDINKNRAQAARDIAQHFGCCMVLKSNNSIICENDRLSVTTSGNPGMATAGMGDVLTGVIAAILVAPNICCNERFERLELAVFLHGLAGDYTAKNGEIGMIATDVIAQLPLAIMSCCD